MQEPVAVGVDGGRVAGPPPRPECATSSGLDELVRSPQSGASSRERLPAEQLADVAVPTSEGAVSSTTSIAEPSAGPPTQ